ncbi:MAG: hypothetical protein JF589_17930 [Gemmatimonadetes bacterium]|nr:hypothetical protein [Gemmatimonadota bacterium]
MTAPAAATHGVPSPDPTPRVSAMTWVSVFVRTLAIQGSWNYETLLGNGVGFVLEPVLRQLPGGVHSDAFKAAMARESAYFGSVGDRLVWAGLLPFSSLVALIAFGVGAGPFAVLAIFLVMYNVGHFGLRIWGLRVGWTRGLAVAGALANPVLRNGPAYIARAAAAVAGIAIPLTVARVVGPTCRPLLEGALLAGALIAVGLVRVHGRVEGWKLVLVLIALFALVSVSVAR